MSKLKGYESRKNYYRHLTRPNGEQLSEKDCLLLDLCTQWTNNGKVATSTYKYLLEEKFPRQKHPRTINRTFKNISLYIKGKFKNTHIINEVVHKDKIRIERVSDFAQKMEEAKEKSQPKKQKNIIQECQPSWTRMSTIVDKNVNPSPLETPVESRSSEPPIKNTLKNTLNDNHDYHENQSQNFIFSDRTETQGYDATNKNGLAKEETVDKGLDKEDIAEYVATDVTKEIKINSTKEKILVANKRKKPTKAQIKINKAKIYKFASVEDRVYYQDNGGKKYWGIPIVKFKFTASMLEEARVNSNKPHFSNEQIRGLLSYISEQYPDKLVVGGRRGFINYLTKLINGEKEYTEAEKLQSLAQERERLQKEINERWANNKIKWM